MATKKGSKKAEAAVVKEEVEEVEEVVKEVAVTPKGVLPNERDYNMPAEQFVTESWLALKGKEPSDDDMALWVRKLTIEGQPRSELHRVLQ